MSGFTKDDRFKIAFKDGASGVEALNDIIHDVVIPWLKDGQHMVGSEGCDSFRTTRSRYDCTDLLSFDPSSSFKKDLLGHFLAAIEPKLDVTETEYGFHVQLP